MALHHLVSVDQYAGANTTVLHVGKLTVWFSYKTPVAFQLSGGVRVVRKNDWGVTTGRHLNAIDEGSTDHTRKGNRVDAETFERLLGEALGGLLVSEEQRRQETDEALKNVKLKAPSAKDIVIGLHG